MKHQDMISRRQFVAIAFVAILSPLIRRFPRVLADTAGRAAWLSAPLAAIPLALALLLTWLMFRRYPPGTGCGELMERVLGAPLARVLCAVYALWLLFYAGFLLRSGALRFVSTVYQGAAPGLFIVGAALVCSLAALGPLKALARSAMLLRPLMIAIFVLIIALTVKDSDYSLLLPVTADDAPGAAGGALQLANLLGVAGYFAFVGDRVEGGLFRARDFVWWLAALLAIIGLMTVGCLAMFGAELTAKMTYPFFMLARDVTILGALERIEPVVIAMWVFSDFILVSALLWIAARNLRFAFGVPDDKAVARLSDLRRGRVLAPLGAVLAAAAAFAVPGEVSAAAWLSETLVPAVSAAMVFGVPLLVFLVGLIRRKI